MGLSHNTLRGAANFAILNVPPHLQRFLFALFLFAADIGDQIVHHLGPAFEGLACAGNGLIGTGQNRYAKAECPVVSNNSANRWTEDVPMVVPELNAHHIEIIPAQRKRLGTELGQKWAGGKK